jgi:hypothetical protein
MTLSVSIAVPYEIKTVSVGGIYGPRTKVYFRLDGAWKEFWVDGYMTKAALEEKISKIVNSTPLNSDDDWRHPAEKYEAMLREQVASAFKTPASYLENEYIRPTPSFPSGGLYGAGPKEENYSTPHASFFGANPVDVPKKAEPKQASYLGSVTKFDEREMKEVRFSQDYVKNYNHGTSGNLGYTTLDKMAKVANELAESRKNAIIQAEKLATMAQKFLNFVQNEREPWGTYYPNRPGEYGSCRVALLEALKSWDHFERIDPIGK